MQYDNRRETVQRGAAIFVILMCAWWPKLGLSQGSFGSAFNAPTVLPIEQAFQIVRSAHDQIEITIAEGVYLYDERTHVESATGEELVALRPPATAYDDPIFGPTPIHRGRIMLQLTAPEDSITLHYQGCADIGFCYPPAKTKLSFSR